MKINKILAQQIVMTVLAVGFLGYVGYRGYLKNDTDTDTVAEANGEEIEVKIEQTDIVKEFVATAKKGSAIPILSNVEGTVKRLFVSNGQQVQKGDLLVSIISNTPSDAFLMRQTESLEYIASLKDILKKLEQSNITTTSEGNQLEQYQIQQLNVKEALARAEANHTILMSQVGTQDIYAPTNGIVQEIQVSEENRTIVKGKAVMQLKTFQNKEIAFTISNNDYRFILDNIGNASAVVLNDKDEVLDTSVSEVSNLKAEGLDDASNIHLTMGIKALYGTFNVERIRWTFKDVAVVSIPYAAVSKDENGDFVWKVNAEGAKEKVLIDIAQVIGDKAYIRKGLNQGDSILLLK